MSNNKIITFNSFNDKKPYDGQHIHVLDKWGYIKDAQYQGEWQTKYWIDNEYTWCEYSNELLKKLNNQTHE